MKKLVAILLCLMMVLSLAACGKEAAAPTEDNGEATGNEPTADVGMANPWVELESVEALSMAAGIEMRLPGVMGITDVHARLLETEDAKLAELQFSVNGMKYVLRASAERLNEDISGVYLDGGETAFAARQDKDDAIVITADMKLARWYNVNGQYVLMIHDDGQMDEETFTAIADEMRQLTTPEESGPAESGTIREGDYYDMTSQRACMSMRALEADRYAIEVDWADSAFVLYVWTMTGTVTEDGRIEYHDCVKKQITTNEDDTVTEREANLIPDGWFEASSGVIYWTGAAEEQCRNCAFAMPE